jgi:hypothetical protein
MTTRHSIDLSTVAVTPTGTFGICKACNSATKLFTFVHKGKVSYRCSVPILANRASKKSSSRPLAALAGEDWGGDVDEWDKLQNGNCRMCNTHMRWNPHTQSRALYVVPVSATTILKGLYCWDCRTLLAEHISQKNAQLMRDLVNAGFVNISSPQK